MQSVSSCCGRSIKHHNNHRRTSKSFSSLSAAGFSFIIIIPLLFRAISADSSILDTYTLNHWPLSLSQMTVRGGSAEATSTLTSTPTSTSTETVTSNTNTTETTKEKMIVGGGAINEKQRSYEKGQGVKFPKLTMTADHDHSGYQPRIHRSHLLHAIEGLDRYPNYLSRWSLDDIDELERSLEQRLDQVRQQKQKVLEQRRGLEQLVQTVCQNHPEWKELLQPPQTWKKIQSEILDSRAAKAIFRSKLFRFKAQQPSVDSVLRGETLIDLDAGHLQELMDEEVFDVYSFPLLSPSFCTKLSGYFRDLMNQLQTTPDLFAHINHGVRDLDNLGLGWLNDLLLHLIVSPISRHLYEETEIHGELDWRQGFIAAYAASPTQSQPRQRLVAHTDDGEITLNICLGDIFEGGSLYFWGLRGNDDAGTKIAGEYQPEIGRAVLHAGRQLHEVSEVTSGNRFAYIMWARSWSGIRSETCPCCWLNRRLDKSCICGKRWN